LFFIFSSTFVSTSLSSALLWAPLILAFKWLHSGGMRQLQTLFNGWDPIESTRNAQLYFLMPWNRRDYTGFQIFFHAPFSYPSLMLLNSKGRYYISPGNVIFNAANLSNEAVRWWTIFRMFIY
jgi:hypothetical protein